MREIKSFSTDINDHKGLYSGRCFIVASGPSLKSMHMDRLAMLEHEYTFAISSLMRWDALPFTPSFYMSQEIRFWWFYQKLLDQLRYPGLKLHANIYSKELPEPWVLIRNDPNKQLDKGHFNGFEDRLDWVAGHGGSATLIATQILAFMGFTELYLLGCDGNTSGYVWDSQAPRNLEDTQLFLKCTKIVHEILKANNVSLIDLTPNGNLDIPKKTLGEVLTCPAPAPVPAIR